MPENPVEQKASDSQILARVRECYANDDTLGGGGVHPETLADDLPIAVNTTRNRCKDLADRGELERDWGFDGGQHRLGYRPARDRTVALRDSETRDDSSHASVVDAQLAEADPETRAEIEERHEVRTDGGVDSSGTNLEIEQPYQDEQYEECDICGGYVDLFRGEYYKSTNDETFRHTLCHENGEPPEGYVFELTDTGKCCTNRQYNCGHLIYAPQTMQPRRCPECNDLEWDGEEWSVGSEPTEADQ